MAVQTKKNARTNSIVLIPVVASEVFMVAGVVWLLITGCDC